MNRFAIALASATGLAAIFVAAAPVGAHAGTMKLDDTIEMFFEGAKARPDFQMTHMCPTNDQCQTVAVATREPDRDGLVGRDIFMKFDGHDKKRHCYQRMVGPNTTLGSAKRPMLWAAKPRGSKPTSRQ